MVFQLRSRGDTTQNIGKIKGLEHVRMKRAGYAIEYDYVDPRELNCMTKKLILYFLLGKLMEPRGMKKLQLKV